MSSDQVQSGPVAVVTTGQEAAIKGILSSSGEANRQGGGWNSMQRTASKDMGSVFPEGTFGNAPQGGGLGLQRTMSKDMGGKAQQTVPGGGLQRTMSRDLGAGPQPGGLQRTMSRDLGAGPQLGGLQRTMSRDLGAGPQPGGLQRTMSRDLGNAQPGGGGLQRTMSRGMGNAAVPKDAPRQPRKNSRKRGEDSKIGWWPRPFAEAQCPQ